MRWAEVGSTTRYGDAAQRDGEAGEEGKYRGREVTLHIRHYQVSNVSSPQTHPARTLSHH
jgi:hypothetical protein